MPAHVFVMDQRNYEICLRRGVVGIPEARDSKNKRSVSDMLISRMCMVRENDFLLFYRTDTSALYGVWQAEGTPFYDETQVWPDKIYPYRVRFRSTDFGFTEPLKLHDIYDLQNEGKISSFALKRASGTNAMFSLSDVEYGVLLNEYFKINPYTNEKRIVPEPYPVREGSLLERVNLDRNGQICYEAGAMCYLLQDLTKGRHKEFFGNYSDYLCYVPTTTRNEIDILLMCANPLQKETISSYNILELKRDVFDEKALVQLIAYETWFLNKKVFGDQKMVRTTAIARSFSEEVKEYVRARTRIEGKPIRLLRYGLNAEGRLFLTEEDAGENTGDNV